MVENLNEICDVIIGKTGTQAGSLLPILQEVQQHFNYLPKEVLELLAKKTDIPYHQFISVSGFYPHFRYTPAGKHTIKVCVGTACHVKGAMQVFDAFARYLQLQNSDTDKDGLFTLKQVACLGCCTLAPAVQIDDITYGKVDQKQVGNILTDFLQKSKTESKSTNKKTQNFKTKGEVKIGLGSCCVASGSAEVLQELNQLKSKYQFPISIKQVGCVGMCHRVPLLEITNDKNQVKLYEKVQPGDVKKIITKNFKPQGFLEKIKLNISNQADIIYSAQDNNITSGSLIQLSEKPVQDFLNKQVYIATQHKGMLNPLDIDEYIANGGFQALHLCERELQPQQIVQKIIDSGLRGRGGAGFTTGKKWEKFLEQSSDKKYIICNGDEGDPGAFMDRMLLESYPYRVIEGLCIAAIATKSQHAFFYIRAEYPLAVQRIKKAIEICRNKNIFSNKFALTIDIFEGAGAFICGEETALIASMEGKRGMPRLRPPYPVEKGLSGYPTLVNNVETFANIAWIINEKENTFNTIGTEKSKGTKVFALAGKIKRGGLIEVPMGISIKEVVEVIGGGIQNDRELKAVQIGGPSGGCLPAELCEVPIDYEKLIEMGAMMGSGGLVVLDETDCVVDIAKYFLSFTQNQSCGKCVYCRVGTKHMLDILQKITDGKAEMSDLDKLELLANQVKKGSICGLGKSAPNPVLTTLKYFKDEYLAHIQEKKCPAKKCKNLIQYQIENSCIGCTKCSQNCPTKAIDFTPYEKHFIKQELCIKCDVCRQVCPTNAVIISNKALSIGKIL